MAIETTTGNAGEATTSGANATEEEEETPLMKIIRYVHYKLFERSAVYCDGCNNQFGDIATGIISVQSLEMYKKRVNQGVQEGICHKNDCFVDYTLRFILYMFMFKYGKRVYISGRLKRLIAVIAYFTMYLPSGRDEVIKRFMIYYNYHMKDWIEVQELWTDLESDLLSNNYSSAEKAFEYVFYLTTVR